MAVNASSSGPALTGVVSCADDSLSMCDESRQCEVGLPSTMHSSIVGMCHPLLDLVANIDDFEAYGLEPATQRLAKGGRRGWGEFCGIFEGLTCQPGTPKGQGIFVARGNHYSRG